MAKVVEFSEKPVGAVLLRIASRAQALIAELLRVSDRVPPVFHPSSDPRFIPVLFDLRYLRSAELTEERIAARADLEALDEDFRETYHPFVERFFVLVDGIVKYYHDLSTYLEDLQEGIYIQSTLESVLENEEGRQLMVEAIVLHGVTLMLLEHRMSGPLREQLLISYYRNAGSPDIPNFDEICTLCRSTSLPAASALQTIASLAQRLQGPPPPVLPTMLVLAKPEELVANFMFPKSVVQTLIEVLTSHDLYHQIRHYPNPEHRTTALAGQASALYVLLWYVPEMLQNDQLAMRSIADKFFREWWVVPVFLGFTVDLSQAWDRLKAGKSALSSTFTPVAVSDVAQRHASRVPKLLSELNAFLSEGVLSQEYLLSNTPKVLSCVRNCNVVLRWFLLHQNTTNKKLRDAVTGSLQHLNEHSDAILSLLLDTAALEFELKRVYGELLEKKSNRWEKCAVHAYDCAQELSEFFAGSKVLSRTVVDENLQDWFQQMALQINSLDYLAPIVAGQKIQHLLTAIQEVEQFHQIESSLQIKQYVSEIRIQLQEMVRLLNIQESVLATVTVVSDAAYAWGLINTFTERIHERTRDEPLTVLKLQCLFLKLRSMIDMPLLRISQCNSLDLMSVSEFYSSELVAYVRAILEVVPVTMFSILNEVIVVEINRLQELPSRLEKDNLRDYAQLDSRYKLAKATHQVAMFTQGILAMKKTFMGVIELDPRLLLEDGVRNQVVKQISFLMHSILVFPPGKGVSFEKTLRDLSSALLAQRRSIEYFQEYVRLQGLQTWQEEFTRIIHYNTEQIILQESNTFLRRKMQGWESTYQNAAVPIPSYSTPDQDQSKALNFMGRLVNKLLQMTHPSQTIYLYPMSGWFDVNGKELLGRHTFCLLEKGLGPAGMRGVDRLLSFKAATLLQNTLRFFAEQVDEDFGKQLAEVETFLTPSSAIPDAGPSVYTNLCSRIGENQAWLSTAEDLAQVGQIQLLRCLIAAQLRGVSKADASLISSALEGLNAAVLATMSSSENSLSWQDNDKILVDLREQLQMCGLHSPLCALYVASDPPKHLSLLLLFLTLSQLPRYTFDSHLGMLTSKTKKNVLDCCPLVIGFGTVLQQFHPSRMTSYVQNIGQYVQTHFENFSMSAASDKASSEIPPEVRNATAWLLSIFKYFKISQELLDLCLPMPFLDGIPK